MTEAKNEDKSIERVRMTVSVSPAEHLSSIEWRKWGINVLKYFAPALSVFFYQLSLGVDWQLALPVALLAFYATLSDLFSKWKEPTITP